MAEEVGSIYYDVDFDTSKLTTGANRVNAALDSAQKGADRTDAAFARAAKSLASTAKATDEESAALRKLLGQIDPTVAATQRLDSLTKQLGQAFDRGQISASDYESNLKKLDAQYGKLEGSTRQAKVTSEGFGAKLAPLAAAIAGVITVQTLAQWGKMAEQFSLFQSRISRLSPDIDTAAASYNSLLQIASRTGATMQNTVKLWESLTGTLKSLGATNEQVLTLTSTLQKIGTIGGSSAEETANAMRQLSQGLAGGTLRAEEFNSVVENTPELARQMAKGFGMSMGQLRQAMLDGKITAEALFDVLLGRTQDVNAEFEKLPRTVSQAANALTTQFGAALSVIDKATNASRTLAAALDAVAKGVQQSFNPTEQEQLNQLIRDRTTAEQQYAVQVKAGLTNTADATSQRIDMINNEIRAIQDRRVAQQKEESKTSGPKAAPATTTDGQKALTQLAEQNVLLRAQGVERAKLAAIQKLGASATDAERKAAVALAVENYNLAEAEKATKKAKTAGESEATKAANARAAVARKAANEEKTGIEQNQKAFTQLGSQLAKVGQTAREAAQDSAQLSLNKYATPEQIQAVRDMAGALYDLKTGKDLLAKVDPIAAETQGYELQLQQLQALNDQKLLSDQRYLELKKQAEVEHEASLTALQEERFRQQSKGNDLLIASINQLQAASTQAFVGLLTGASNGQQAVQALAGAILNEAVGAVVAFGFAQLKSLIIGQSVGTAATAATVAQAGIAATAWATPAALASLATLGTNSVPAGAALSGTVALSQGLALGARQYGGPVQGERMYRVNEGGGPEIFNAAGGKQYMMPNTRGEVVSNKDATSSGGDSAAPIININNYGSGAASASSKWSDADRRFIIDVTVADAQSGGRLGQTVNQITGTQRRGA